MGQPERSGAASGQTTETELPGPDDLQIEAISWANRVDVTLHGELVYESAAELGRRLHEVEASQPTTLVLDLRDLRFMDSSGLSELIRADQRARLAGRRLLLVKGPGPIERILTISGLTEVFEIGSEIPPDSIA